MLADALAENATLQTLKLQGNDVQTEGTLKAVHELLKKNREAARKKFEADHPDRVTHKLKKPPPKEKKKRRSRRGGEERKNRSGDEKRRGSGGARPPSSSSRGKPSSAKDGRDRREAAPKTAATETNKAATLTDRFRGLGFGGNKKQVAEDGAAGPKRNDGLAQATFV